MILAVDNKELAMECYLECIASPPFWMTDGEVTHRLVISLPKSEQLFVVISCLCQGIQGIFPSSVRMIIR